MEPELFKWILFPPTEEDLGKFYLFWIGLFLFVNIVLDIISRHTPPFALERLPQKVNVVYAGSTLASSIMLIVYCTGSTLVGCDDKGVLMLPIAISSLVGVLSAFSQLTPAKQRLPVITDDEYQV